MRVGIVTTVGAAAIAAAIATGCAADGSPAASPSAPPTGSPPAPTNAAQVTAATPPAARAFGPALRAAVAAAQAAKARAHIDAALAPDGAERWRRRRALTFSDGGAVFALDDAWALLAQAPRPRRAAVLAALAPALSERHAVDQPARDRVAAAALAAGVSARDLYARQVGLDGRVLTALVDQALAAPGDLLGPVAGDVTLVPDVLAPPPWLRRGEVPTAAAGAVAPAAAWALWYGDVPRPPTPDDAAAYARALAVELRLAALSWRALDAAPTEQDALAGRALLDGAEPMVGAGVLLDVDPSGAVVERFVGLLRAPAVARARWAGESLAAVVKRLEQAPPADQEGYPEAFWSVARLLPEVGR